MLLSKSHCSFFTIINNFEKKTVYFVSIHHVQHLKVLAIITNSNRNWIPHINHIRVELTSYHNNSIRLTSKLGVEGRGYITLHLKLGIGQ